MLGDAVSRQASGRARLSIHACLASFSWCIFSRWNGSIGSLRPEKGIQAGAGLLLMKRIDGREMTIKGKLAKVFIPSLLALSIALRLSAGLAQELPARNIQVKISVGEQILTATFIDNATARALIKKLPLTLPMMDLYAREMCYRFPEALPSEESGTRGYTVGDIAYWTPRHSFVIFYEQNNEIISHLQKIGHIDDGVEIFQNTGNINITLDLLNEP